MGFNSSKSTMKITDVMITAERTAFGINASEGIRNAKANRTRIPNNKEQFE